MWHRYAADTCSSRVYITAYGFDCRIRECTSFADGMTDELPLTAVCAKFTVSEY